MSNWLFFKIYWKYWLRNCIENKIIFNFNCLRQIFFYLRSLCYCLCTRGGKAISIKIVLGFLWIPLNQQNAHNYLSHKELIQLIYNWPRRDKVYKKLKFLFCILIIFLILILNLKISERLCHLAMKISNLIFEIFH